MKTVVFDTRAWCLNVFPQMMNHFHKDEKQQIKPVSVFHNVPDQKKFRTANVSENLNDYFNKGIAQYSKEQIVALEEKYDLINLWHVVYFDRFLKEKDEEFIVRQISYYIYAWEEIFKKHKPDYILNETVTGLWNYIPYALSKHYNCEYLGFLFTKNTNKYFFTKDILGTFPEMISKFNSVKISGLNAGQKQEVNSFEKNFREKHLVPSYMKFTSSLPKVYNFFNPYRVLINIYKDLKTFFLIKNDYKIDYRFQGYNRDLLRLYRVMYIKVFKMFDMPDKDEKYILFPLHYQPEASTDIWAAYHTDQYNVIVNLAKSLPFDHKLYVKEHYAVLGSKRIDFYKKIKKLPNVKLINPWVKISELINRSDAVAVLTGTTGLEAIILKKPVLMFGHVFFDIYPQLYKVKDLEQLPELINDAINNFKVNEDVYEKYIYAYIKSGYEGRLHGNNFSSDEITLHCENLLKEINNHTNTEVENNKIRYRKNL